MKKTNNFGVFILFMVILQKKQKLILSFFLIPAFLAVSFFFTHAQTASISTLKKLDVSAYIISSKNKSVPNGVHQVRFAIYKKDRTVPDPYPSSSDSPIWEETQDIDFKDGILRAQLGENKAFPATLNFNDDEYYLGIRIDTDSEMVPRKRLGAVALSISTLNLEGHVTGENAGNIPVLDDSGQLLETMIPEVTEVGTISTGTWEADVIESGYIAKALTGKTYNGLTISTSGNSFSIYKGASNKLTMTNGALSLSTMGSAGSVVYSNGTAFSFTSAGTAGQVLYSNGTGAPTWASLAGGSITPDSLNMT
ncbi:MAG TPA: hypothetical protein PLK35_04215, partial [Candidatus Moranbacteria bacterium]|nr:hypothetical protein [Candidatus Moranbacteria bacterium]